MVASGLTERVDVSQYRLATHLTLACVIFAACVWTAARLAAREAIEAPPRIRASAIALLVARVRADLSRRAGGGPRAGLIYNTWPLIDGAFIPDAARLFFEQPLWRNFFENALTVQFIHRMVAYALFARSRCCTPSTSRARCAAGRAGARARAGRPRHAASRARHR